MKRKLSAIAIAALSTVPLAFSAAAQPATQALTQQPNVKTVYEAPTNTKFTPIYERLKQRRVLEELQAFMAPMRLPRELTVRIAQCGTQNLAYKPQGPATVCYELIDQIERFTAAHTRDANLAQIVITGGFVQALLHETAHSLFDILQVPVWGREDDAADRLAALIMMQFGDDVANVVMYGTQLLFRWSDQKWQGNAFASEVSPDYQRYFNYACVAVAANWPQFGGLVQNKVIPEHRARRCDSEYHQIRKAFDLRIMPHIDADQLVKVRATNWLAWANQQ
jgi:hypothetical protein